MILNYYFITLNDYYFELEREIFNRKMLTSILKVLSEELKAK